PWVLHSTIRAIHDDLLGVQGLLWAPVALGNIGPMSQLLPLIISARLQRRLRTGLSSFDSPAKTLTLLGRETCSQRRKCAPSRFFSESCSLRRSCNRWPVDWTCP